MTRAEAEEALTRLNAAIATAAMVIDGEKETLNRFFAEQQRFDTVAPILDPTLWNNNERRATEATLTPIYKVAREFVRVYEFHARRASAALSAAKRSGQ